MKGTTKAGRRILAGLEEARAWARGEAVEGAVFHPARPAPSELDAKALRTRLGLTQPAFAARFGLSVGTVRDWEQGRVTPDGAARVLLRVIERHPEAVAETVAAEGGARAA